MRLRDLIQLAFEAQSRHHLRTALTLGGITFGAGIPPLLPAAIGGSEVASVPWVLIPTTLVPMYLILHGVVFARLRLGTVTSRIPEAAAA